MRGEAEIKRFGKLMQAELLANDHKPGWVGMTTGALRELLQEEYRELLDEIVVYANSQVPSRANLRAEERARIASEAADLANAAMFIAHNFGALPSLDPDWKTMLAIMVDRYQGFGHPIIDEAEIEERNVVLYLERTGDRKGHILKAVRDEDPSLMEGQPIPPPPHDPAVVTKAKMEMEYARLLQEATGTGDEKKQESAIGFAWAMRFVDPDWAAEATGLDADLDSFKEVYGF